MRIALIGCGAIAQVHAKSIAALAQEGEQTRGAAESAAAPGADICLAAAADCDFERACIMARQYGAAPYRDFTEMLDKEKPDAVHICTPHMLHTPMAAEALARGIHVFTEKPPVISWAQLEELKSAVQNAQGKARLAVCFQNRLNESVQYAKRILSEGRLGAVKGFRGFVTWQRGAEYYTQSTWRGKIDTEGGGALINQGIHTLDLIQYLAGEAPLYTDAVLGNFHLKNQIEVEDTFSAYIEYPHARAVYYATTAYAADKEPLIEAECEMGVVRIEGDTVTVLCGEDAADDTGAGENHRRTEADGGQAQVSGQMRFPQKEYFGKKYWGWAHKDAIAGFYRSIEQGRPFLLDFEQTQESVKLMLGLYEAARGKQHRGQKKGGTEYVGAM